MAVKKLGQMIERIASTVTAAGTTTLLFNSPTFQQFTGTTTQTVVLPDATTCPKGLKFVVLNRSTGAVTVNYNGGSLAATVAAGAQKTFRVVDNGTSAGTWDLTNESSSGGAASLSTSQKFGVIAALANQNFQDSQIISKKVTYNTEEIGGAVWLSKSALPSTQRWGSGFSLNGFGYAVAGDSGSGATNTLSRFTDDDNFWISRTVLPASLDYLRSFTFNGSSYAVGGTTSTSESNSTNGSYKYSDATNAWTSVANLIIGKSFPSAIVPSNPMIVGGITAALSSLNTSEFYDDAANAWYSRATLTTARDGAVGFTLGDVGYVAGGGTGVSTGFLSTTEKYVREVNAWVLDANLAGSARMETEGAAVNGFAYFFGGYTGSPSTLVDEYNSATGAWTASVVLTSARTGVSAFSLNGAAYAAGGSPVNTTVEQFRDTTFVNVGSLLRSSTVPSSILTSVALNGLLTSVPVQIRTDGDAWKNLLSNSDSATKFGETLKTKFIETPSLSALGGASTGVTRIGIQTRFSDTVNVWVTKASYPSTPIEAACVFHVNGFGYASCGYNGTSFITSTQRYNDLTDSWTSKASASNFHGYMGFQLNGFGYVGNAGTGYSNIVEKYNDSTNAWSNTANLNESLNLGTGCAVNGKGYSISGSTAGGTSSVTEQYNDLLNTWTNVASVSSGRTELSSFALNTFMYSVTGGNPSPSTIIEKYNSSTNAWSSAASYPISTYETMSGQLNGYGYGFGGTASGSYFTNAYRYADGANTWTSVASLGTPQADGGNMGYGTYRGYEVRVGVPASYYRPGTGIWTTKQGVINFGTGQVSSNNVGGQGSIAGGNNGGTSSTAHTIYDPTLDVGKQNASMNVGRRSHGAFTLYGRGYAVNGTTGSNTFVNSGEYFDGILNTWTSIATSSASKRDMANFALNGIGYNVAGNSSGTSVATSEKYNPITNAWSSSASIATATDILMGWSLNGFGYSGGGRTGSPAVGTSQRYNDADNTWTTITSINTARTSSYAFSIAEGLTVSGGVNSGAATINTTESYSDSLNVWQFRANMSITENTNGGVGATSLNNVGYTFGGSSGVTTITQYNNSLKSVVLGIGLRIS